MTKSAPADADLASMAEVRAAIDALDERLVACLAARARAVESARGLGDMAEARGAATGTERRLRREAAAVGFDADRAVRIFNLMLSESAGEVSGD